MFACFDTDLRPCSRSPLPHHHHRPGTRLHHWSLAACRTLLYFVHGLFDLGSHHCRGLCADLLRVRVRRTTEAKHAKTFSHTKCIYVTQVLALLRHGFLAGQGGLCRHLRRRRQQFWAHRLRYSPLDVHCWHHPHLNRRSRPRLRWVDRLRSRDVPSASSSLGVDAGPPTAIRTHARDLFLRTHAY